MKICKTCNYGYIIRKFNYLCIIFLSCIIRILVREFSSSLTPGESVHELYVVDLKLKSSALFVFFADLVFNAVVSVCCEPQRIQLCDFKGSPFLFFSFFFFLLLAVFFVFIQKVQLVCER